MIKFRGILEAGTKLSLCYNVSFASFFLVCIFANEGHLFYLSHLFYLPIQSYSTRFWCINSIKHLRIHIADSVSLRTSALCCQIGNS